MLFIESIKMALRAIWSNKVRSVLTMLGVIIGVSSVISLMAMGQGVKKGITREVTSIGSNILGIVSGNISADGSGQGMAGMAGVSSLTWQDRKAIEENISGISNVAGLMMVQGALDFEGKKAVPMLIGGEADLEFLNLYNIKTGRFLNNDDVEDKSYNIVIGSTIVKELFGEGKDEEVLGKKLVINGEEFEIIGVMETESMSTVGMDANSMAVIPISITRKMYDTDQLMRILLQVEDKDNIENVKQQAHDLLLERHKGNEDFSILTQDDMLSMMDQILSLVTALLSGIASISLMVGGIGIMNIMLVSVTERTREVGIRKAIGATNGNILSQFLVEAAVISLIGGGIGVLLAWIGGLLVGHFTPITPEITLSAVLLAFGISVFVGIVFGVAPAIKASRKDPIEALRYE